MLNNTAIFTYFMFKLTTDMMFLYLQSRATDSGPDTDGEDDDDENDVQGELMEGTSRGIIKGSLMIRYMRSGGSSIFALLVLFLFMATQFCVSFNDWFIPQLYV